MRKLKRRGFTMVELMMVVAIIGILVAIAIPVFLRFIATSKTSEAEGTMKKIAEGAKGYFAAEQRYSNPVSGAEPWHQATPSAIPGMPVSWSNYVFPGASATSLNTAEPECTGGGPDAINAPSGGKKHIPCAGIAPPTGSLHAATLNKLRANAVDPLYFKYFYEAEGAGIAATATIYAIADFNPGGPAHTVQQMISVDTTQEVFISPPSITHEFE